MDDIYYCADCGELLEEDHICHLSENISNDVELESSEIVLQSEVENIEELINEVFQRSPLWDSSLPYKNRGPSEIKSLWSEIDKKLNLCPGTANTKWRNLRDTYVRKLNEENKYIPSGSAVEAKPKSVSWPYFELMGFLRSTVTRRKTFSNIQPPAPFNNKDKSYIKQSSKEPNFRCFNPSNSSIYKKEDSFLEDSSMSSPTTSDIENFAPQNQSNSRSTVSNYSLMRQKSKELEESKASKIQVLSHNTDKKHFQIPDKKRRTSINKNDEFLSVQQSLLSEIKKTDESMNKTISDPVTAFCNYLATQLRTLPQHNFITCQRKILSLLFELQDDYTQ